ncbi:ATP-binding protein [Alkalicoccus halolimnae]|uniref:histidine kinase n=1 Tax=Alkalicoccus halolimnae TaxID=1667239 RepID=A0A5C7FL82_9BACI|nr:ATP-binding protein [Alkalicoccus halolimnae]TXF86859.1 response regulator [Alkalicoccus halolimnae]
MKKEQGRKSLRSGFLWQAALFITTVVIAGAAFFTFIGYDQGQHDDTHQTLVHKVQTAEEVKESLQRLFYHARAYYAYQNEADLEEAEQDLAGLNAALEEFRALDLTAEERAFAEELAAFSAEYESSILPEASNLAEAGDYEGLRTFMNEGTLEDSDTFFEQAGVIRNEAFTEMQNEYNEIISQSNRNIVLVMGFGALVFLAMILGSQRLLRKLIVPIEELTTASDELAEGRTVHIDAADRKDEIGALGSSFVHMSAARKESEEALKVRNRELSEQREKLENSLEEVEREKIKIDRYSLLNQTMSTKLDKTDFLTSIFTYINEMYPCDKSMLDILDEEDYRADGLTLETIVRWKEADKSELLQRLRNQPHVVVKREAVNGEKGVAEGRVDAFEYYTVIKDGNGNAIALYSSVKIGNPYTAEEMEEIEAVMSHVGLGLERALVYEEIARSRKLNQDIMDNVSEAIQFVDTEGSTMQVNQSMCTMMFCGSWQKESVLPRETWEEVLLSKVSRPEELRSFFAGFFDEAFEGTLSQQYEQTIDGKRHVITVYGTTVYDEDEKSGTVFVYRDMTREYELDQMKSELVSTVSHELRTPLSSVLGFTELLLTKELKPERQNRYLTTIHKEAKRLTTLINDFLDLQRMEAGTQSYQMEHVQMNELAMEVIYQFKHEKNHHLSLIDEALESGMKADRDRLYQVLTNLVSNAVKFSPGGGEVTLHLRNEKESLILAVEDEGLGIPADAVNTLFNKFQRIDDGGHRNIGGTGLGLAISREIIERHGGQIWVESEAGRGSIFYISMPVYRSVTEVNQGISPGGDAVMIVEDDSSLALLLSEELKSSGFKTIHHFHPERAYEDILRTKPAAVVIDLMLGEAGNGWSLVHRLKENETTKDLPIIISSALDRPDEKMKRYGIDQYLTKPYPPQALSETLLSFVQSTEASKGYVLFPQD